MVANHSSETPGVSEQQARGRCLPCSSKQTRGKPSSSMPAAHAAAFAQTAHADVMSALAHVTRELQQMPLFAADVRRRDDVEKVATDSIH